jgi:hypothetical protein
MDELLGVLIIRIAFSIHHKSVVAPLEAASARKPCAGIRHGKTCRAEFGS